MMPRGQPTTLQERLEIQDRARAGQSDPEIARALGRPLATVRKWRRRAQHHGRTGLASRMGRPAQGALSTFPAVVRDTIRHLRQVHPGWGPLTIREHLSKLEELQDQSLPERSSIARYLRQEGLTRRYERHSELPQPAVVSAQRPHDQWEIDAAGAVQVPGVGRVSVINLCDVYSKIKLMSYACRASKPTGADYQLSCRLAFLRWGRPRWLACDRDSPFHDSASASPYPTPLHLWLIGMGVELVFGPPYRPTARATDERFHRTMHAQAIQGQTFDSWAALQATLEERLEFLNCELPCRTLDHRPPLVAYPEAVFSDRFYHPVLEAELLDLQRIYDYLAAGRWFRRVAQFGQVSLGNHRYGLGATWGKQTVEITFDPTDQHFQFRSEDGTQTQRLPAQGLTKSELMGELAPLVTLPAFQLALPFTPQEWQVIRLCETLGDTTL